MIKPRLKRIIDWLRKPLNSLILPPQGWIQTSLNLTKIKIHAQLSIDATNYEKYPRTTQHQARN